ncbi:hypothetical protein [Pseudonocardia nigra]|uniref:hypothetical protein n=1 Tax=Pseudonocardia nigra TaxID=1921578 RepID=UPI001C5F312B|nr:hypothetical protein [Pseudonocardia nigra]
MLNPAHSPNFSRTFAALCLVAGPVLLLVSGLVAPTWSEDPNAYLDAIAASGNANIVGAFLFLVGVILTIGGLIGVLHLTRGKHVTVAQVGAGMMIVGALFGNWFYAAILETTAARPGLDRGQMIALFDQAEQSPWGIVGFLSYLVGIVLGSIVLAVGLLLRRAAPVWAPIALIASTVVGYFSGDSFLLSLVSFALLVVGFAGVAWRMLTLTDEQWAQWQPLPDAPRRTRRSMTTEEPAGPALA